MSASAADAAPTPAPLVDPAQEIRFAIVIYGGVSLAVYINGVAQEMLRMVRATAAVYIRRFDVAGCVPLFVRIHPSRCGYKRPNRASQKGRHAQVPDPVRTYRCPPTS